MAVTIRPATTSDAPRWLDLLKAVYHEDYPSKKVYEPAWIASQLGPVSGNETWVADVGGRLHASVTLLSPPAQNVNPVLNLGCNLFRPEGYSDGSAEALLQKVNELAASLKHLVIIRVLASDNPQQVLLEKLGFTCAGFQPFKHALRAREAVLFYIRFGKPDAVARMPLSETLPLVSDLSSFVLHRLNLAEPQMIREGTVGYPLQSELTVADVPIEEYDSWRVKAQSANPLIEISRAYNLRSGLLRTESETPLRGMIGTRENQAVAGLSYFFDEQDRCMHIVDCAALDDLSMGVMFGKVIEQAQTKLNAVYVETDLLMTAPRLIKSTEQLGFVTVAYFPATYWFKGQCVDVVKLMKLNMIYSLENANLTSHARSVVEIIDRNFQDQKLGVAIVNMLRTLPVFAGLGDGELRKIARLFTQKLYRPGDAVFAHGDKGNEAYVVMRGQIDIILKGQSEPVASITSGQIFGEQAFLDGAARVAMAQAKQASILLVIQRSAFTDLVQREPHLGMVVFRNTGIELSNKLRNANALLASLRK